MKDLLGDSSVKSLIDFHKEDHPWVTSLRDEISAPQDEVFVVLTQASCVGKGGLSHKLDEKVSVSAAAVSRYLS